MEENIMQSGWRDNLLKEAIALGLTEIKNDLNLLSDELTKFSSANSENVILEPLQIRNPIVVNSSTHPPELLGINQVFPSFLISVIFSTQIFFISIREHFFNFIEHSWFYVEKPYS